MGRSTFSGPILAATQREGALRNAGYSHMVQTAVIDLTQTTAGSPNYSGGSGQFVTNNYASGSFGQNLAANVYTPSSTVYPSVVATIPADSATDVYRGVVMYLPVNSVITGINVAVGAVPALTGTISSTEVYVSNAFTVAGGTPTYAMTSPITAVGNQTLATATAAELAALASSSVDILQSNAPDVSQVVFTVAVVGTGLAAPFTAGLLYFNVSYMQVDQNLGNTTTYPYLNNV
jgi:hypothetical protein